MCSFSFPVVFVLFLSVTGIRTDKEPYRAKVFVSFGTFRRDTEISVLSVNTFFNCFSGKNAMTPVPTTGRTREARGVVRFGILPGALLFALRTLFR